MILTVTRVCGVLDGDPPFGLPNGSMPEAVFLTNKWWIVDLLKPQFSKGIDCSLMADLVKEGYNQTIKARK